MVDKGIQICIKDGQRRRKLGGLFGNSEMLKVLPIPDLQTKQVSTESLIVFVSGVKFANEKLINEYL